MRPFAAIPWIALVLVPPVHAKGPDPKHCTVEANLPEGGCPFRFSPDGSLDRLRSFAVVRDSFGVPIEHCSIRATLKSAGATTLALCACSPCGVQSAPTNENG